MIDKIKLSIALLICLGHLCMAQQLTQTIRGNIIDKEGQFPLIGATVSLDGTSIGNVSDNEGYFRLEDIPIGRYDLVVSYLGYKENIIPNLLVQSSKEVILNIELQEAIEVMDEVVIIASQDKTDPLNKLATVSSRQFTVEESGRYAGSRGEPSRMAQNYAGVSGSSDGRNDIIIRGNSPIGMLWRYEGLDIPNPNHFALSGSNGGTISILNLNVLSNSDFLTSAFPADYGNAMSGVFDLKMRSGNNEKREYSVGAGALGVEATLEGPLGNNKKVSYLLNYRYSTVELLNKTTNLQTGFSGDPVYQDASFKINIPSRKLGNISIFGMGGISTYTVLAEQRDSSNFDILFTDNANASFDAKMGVIGMAHKFIINTTTYINSVIGMSGNSETSQIDSVSRETKAIIPWQRNDNSLSRIQLHTFLNKKLSKQLLLKTGIIGTKYSFSLNERIISRNSNELQPFRVGNGKTMHWQSYMAWQWRSKKEAIINWGLHYQFFGLNNTKSLEWRLGARLPLANSATALTFGAGLHGQLQMLPLYFVNDDQDQTNLNLDFSKSHHLVAGINHNFNSHFRLKGEVYGQFLFNIPVESNLSSFSILNEGGDFLIKLPPGLVNEGTGTNYGIELTLEKFYSRGYYFLSSTSLFRSRYKGSNGISFPTKFDSGYIINLLAGKEFSVGKKNRLIFDVKTSLAGGRRYTPISLEDSRLQNRQVLLNDQAFSLQYDPYFRTDFKITYRINNSTLSHEIYINIDNVFNTTNLFSEYYNTFSQEIVTINQLGLFPTFLWKVIF